jgi:hypothetical protein
MSAISSWTKPVNHCRATCGGKKTTDAVLTTRSLIKR